MSVSNAAEKKEDGAVGDPSPCQVPLPASAPLISSEGAQVVAIAAHTLSNDHCEGSDVEAPLGAL